MTNTWQAYYPDDGETADDARILTTHWNRIRIFCEEDAAQTACEYDYSNRDGWERTMEEPFSIVVIAPDGKETRWSGRHEPSVEHRVTEAEDDG